MTDSKLVSLAKAMQPGLEEDNSRFVYLGSDSVTPESLSSTASAQENSDAV